MDDNERRGDPVRRLCCHCPREHCACCYRECGFFGTCSPTKVIVYIIYLFSLIWLVVSSIVLRNTVYSSKLHDVAWYIATFFVMMTLPMSAYAIGNHLKHYHDPDVQRYIVRILWMVPIYAVESLLALIWYEYNILLETMRECYEAYVIFCLLQLMIVTVAHTPEQFQEIANQKNPHDLQHMSFFKYCLKPWSSFDFFSKVRRGTLQYVVVKIVCTIIELITVSIPAPVEPSTNTTTLPHYYYYDNKHQSMRGSDGGLGFTSSSLSSPSSSSSSSSSSSRSNCMGNEVEGQNYYCEGCFRLDRAYGWVTLATNFSQLWAMYCLVLFYHAFMKELQPIQPLGKLLCVKAVVFFSFYQEVGVTICVALGWITATENPASTNSCFSKEDVARGFQDFLICSKFFKCWVFVESRWCCACSSLRRIPDFFFFFFFFSSSFFFLLRFLCFLVFSRNVCCCSCPSLYVFS